MKVEFELTDERGIFSDKRITHNFYAKHLSHLTADKAIKQNLIKYLDVAGELEPEDIKILEAK